VTGEDRAAVADLQARLAERDREIAELRAAVAAEHARLDRELALARRIQLNLMPPVAPQLPGWTVATGYRAALVVGGDFYDVYELPGRPGLLGLVIADVTGKGLTAALMMAFSRAVLRAAAYNGTGPADALKRTNRVLVRDARTGLFLTALVGELDGSAGTFRYASAGHEAPLVFRAGSGAPEMLAGEGQLLGVFDDPSIDERAIELATGDLVLAYTDGATDARDPSGQLFGEDRLRAAVTRFTPEGPAAVVKGVLEAVDAFAGGTPQADDVTLLAFSRN
jgi:sigma-B regulation protein RsbU (phosphoserine phosphatase)